MARLKETAIDCNFSLKCTADLCDSQVCYTEEMIRDQAVYGMNCSDTQAKILTMGSDLLPLASVIKKAEAEESVKKAAASKAAAAAPAKKPATAPPAPPAKPAPPAPKPKSEKEMENDALNKVNADITARKNNHAKAMN